MTRKNHIKANLFLALMVTANFLAPSATVSAVNDFYSSNDILFYDSSASNCTPGGTVGSTATGGTVSSLAGADNAEKVWNYFISKGLTPVAAAGAMGNIEKESSFDPLLQEKGSGIGFGLIQWSFDRRDNLEKAAAARGVSFANGADNDAALLFQLDYLWDVEYGKPTWQDAVNAETSVDGNPSIDFRVDNTGNGSTLVFHKLVERSGDRATGKQKRIDSAKKFLERFAGGGASGISSECNGANFAGASSSVIVNTAMEWAHKEPVLFSGGGRKNPGARVPTDKYKNEVGKYSSIASSNYTDCTYFVGAVMRKALNDTNFPEAGTIQQFDYAKNSGKFDIIYNPTVDQAQPGDLIITPLGSGASDNGVYNHIAIYGGDLGEYNGKKQTMLEASQQSFAPQASTSDSLTYQLKSSKTVIARLKSSVQL